MKKFFLFSALLFAATVSWAQVSFGVRAGLNLPNQVMKISIEELSISRTGDRIASFHIGGYADVALSDKFSLRPELLLSGKGTKFKAGDDDLGPETEAVFRPYYLEVPVSLVFTTPLNDNISGYLGAGPYIAYGLFGKGKSGDESVDLFDDEGYKRFDAGIHLQTGIKLQSGFTAGFAFVPGFTNTANSEEDDEFSLSMKNNVLMFSIGFQF